MGRKLSQQLMDLFGEYLTLERYDVDRKASLEWEFEDAVYREVFTYKGMEVEVTDQSLEDNEVVIVSLDGFPIHEGEYYVNLNVPQFIELCCN